MRIIHLANHGVADADRLPNTTSLALPGASAETLVIALDLAGIAVSAGAACSSGKVGASHVLAAMGLEPELARAAATLRDADDLRSSMAEAGLKRTEDFDWDRVTAQVASLYDELLGRG